ncbi:MULTISPECIES: cupin domain-containing protein [Pseudomonas]|uniref:cupin domain-containing protein n=1 Tax=Pseudomonas TaxID=286 RepID=UPI000354FDA3|nr:MULTISPECIES: cupin domain-containing protein [Pseudomonas]EPJ86052.1 purine nucleoside permease [Pseudomonas sp. CFII68]
MTKKDIQNMLSLRKHVEGGFFSQTFDSAINVNFDRAGLSIERGLASVIYYLLTDDSPIGYLHTNLSPIIHFYHSGSPITYRYIHMNGDTEEHILGPDLVQGHSLQLYAPADIWKCSELQLGGEYGLISEVTVPAWNDLDSRLGQRNELLKAFPQHAAWIEKYSIP